MARATKRHAERVNNATNTAADKSPLAKKPRLDKEVRKEDEVSRRVDGQSLPALTASKHREESQQPREPPVPPPSVPASHILLPPEADNAKIRASHDIYTISIHASSKIESKVRQVLVALKPMKEQSDENDPSKNKKSVIVALTARAPAGNKCISVAEISKREMSKTGMSLWQYTGCWTRLETVENKTKSVGEDKKVEGVDGAAEDLEKSQDNVEEKKPALQETFDPERKLVRNVVCVVVYISAEPVSWLKELYGEQITGSIT